MICAEPFGIGFSFKAITTDFVILFLSGTTYIYLLRLSIAVSKYLILGVIMVIFLRIAYVS
jgi:hypothetical protein